MAAPDGAQLSEDGLWWWDDSIQDWRSVEDDAPAGSVSGGAGSEDDIDWSDVGVDVPMSPVDGAGGSWTFTEEELEALAIEDLPANVEGVDFSFVPPVDDAGDEETSS